jgi:aryl sulfotransferase
VTIGPIHYQWPGEDSGRWLGFRFRPGDIVISTRRSTGTTWMQMICALLIFQTPELPDPLWHLSPWLDSQIMPHDYVYHQLDQQRHRRFIKTHTPLDGIPVQPQVTYIVTARDPLDTFVSLRRHNEIIGPPPDAVGLPPGGIGPPGPPGPPPRGTGHPGPPGPPPPDGGPPPGSGVPAPGHFGPPPGGGAPPPDSTGHPPGGVGPPGLGPPGPPGVPKAPEPPATREMLHDALVKWIAADRDPREHPDSLAGVMWHLSDAWARRGEPNVVLVRYEDLLADLEGQMRRLAGRLGITVPEPAWPTLTQAATFGHMKDRADTLVQAPPGISGDAAAFFRRGTSGAGRELLSDEELADYHAHAARLAAPDLLGWLSVGLGGATPPDPPAGLG